MAKSLEKIKARELRKKGESIKDIAKQLNVSKSSVSIWCKDIILTNPQILALQKKMVFKGSYEARMRGAHVQKERRAQQIIALQHEGYLLASTPSKENILYLGTGLYWGEGGKNTRTSFSNSNPKVIMLFMKWMTDVWNISNDRLVCRVLINETHSDRIGEVEEYWSKTLKIHKSQFRKTTFIKTQSKKVYENRNNHYGTLMVIVRKSSDLLHKINGLIARMSEFV